MFLMYVNNKYTTYKSSGGFTGGPVCLDLPDIITPIHVS